MAQDKIGFLGAGNMARSIAGGLLDAGYSKEKILAADPNEAQQQLFGSSLDIQVFDKNESLLEHSEIIVLAVKPQIMQTALTPLAERLRAKKPLLISIAAGIHISHIQRWAGGDLPVVRVMPNTPALVRSGASALFASPQVNEEQRNIAESIMRAVGVTVWLPEESLLDQVTALSGSGPAYFFYLMEGLEESAIASGLAPDTARLLTLETALGAAKLALESLESPAELRRRVTSPGGTTEQAIKTLESANTKNAITKAFEAARKRSEELGETAS